MTYGGSTPASPVTLTHGYDSMGRPNALTDLSGATLSGLGMGWSSGTPVNWAQNVSYDYAGRMSSMQYFVGMSYSPFTLTWNESWTQQTTGYNTNRQLTSLGLIGAYALGTGFGGPSTGITYTYSTTQNNGEITQATGYTLGRGDQLHLRFAEAVDASLLNADQWHRYCRRHITQAFQFDGFGNLDGKGSGTGPATPIGVNGGDQPAPERELRCKWNMTSGSGATI